MAWEKEISEVHRKRELAKQLGGSDGVARQHAKGRMTIRERIDGLLGTRPPSLESLSLRSSHIDPDDEFPTWDFSLPEGAPGGPPIGSTGGIADGEGASAAQASPSGAGDGFAPVVGAPDEQTVTPPQKPVVSTRRTRRKQKTARRAAEPRRVRSSKSRTEPPALAKEKAPPPAASVVTATEPPVVPTPDFSDEVREIEAQIRRCRCQAARKVLEKIPGSADLHGKWKAKVDACKPRLPGRPCRYTP